MYERLVRVFHETYGVDVEQSPVIPSKEICKLRIELIQEELNEFKEALESGDLEHAIKELADIYYVVAGTSVAMGLHNGIIGDAFKEVHRSNMSKVCKDEQTARKLTNGTGAIREVPGGFVAYNSSGKVLKPEAYSKADLSFLFNE